MEETSILKLQSKFSSQVLYFLGAKHTNNPDDEQFMKMETLWTEFLQHTHNERIALVEKLTPSRGNDIEEYVRLGGESGALVFHAESQDIPVMCPEPDEKEQRQMLCQSFDPVDVAYSFVMQNLAAWFRHARQSSFQDAVDRSIARESKFSGVYGFLPTKENLNQWFTKSFGSETLEDKDLLDSISDPRKKNTIVNQVVALRTSLRNEYIYNYIEDLWRSGKSIFIVYGRGHLHVLQEKLQQLVDKSDSS
jgi:hypothetical protein